MRLGLSWRWMVGAAGTPSSLLFKGLGSVYAATEVQRTCGSESSWDAMAWRCWTVQGLVAVRESASMKLTRWTTRVGFVSEMEV